MVVCPVRCRRVLVLSKVKGTVLAALIKRVWLIWTAGAVTMIVVSDETVVVKHVSPRSRRVLPSIVSPRRRAYPLPVLHGCGCGCRKRQS